jgi:ABC-2 type transport system permease protein
MFTTWKALIRKDLRLFFSNRRALLMSVAAPIAIASFFGYALGGSGNAEHSKIPVLVADQDNSAISKQIVAMLAASKELEVKPSTLDAARAAVRKGKAIVAIGIPEGFGADASKAFFGGAKPKMEVLYDPSHSAEQAMVAGILTGEVMQAVSKETFSGPTGRKMVDDSLKRLEGDSSLPPAQKQALVGLLRSVRSWNDQNPSDSGQNSSGGLTIPYEMHAEAITSGSGVHYNGYAHAFGGMGIQFILFVGIDIGIGVLLLRQRGLWKRYRAAPLSRATLLGSRATSAAITSMFVLMVLFGFARLVFGVRIEGSMAGFLCICAAFSLMTAAFGLLIAALGKTPEATRGLAIFVTLIMVMLGGAWVPAFIFPQWLQSATLLVPTRWAMDGLDAMTWRGLGFSAAIGPIAVLTFCALLFGLIAVARFRWEES